MSDTLQEAKRAVIEAVEAGQPLDLTTVLNSTSEQGLSRIVARDAVLELHALGCLRSDAHFRLSAPHGAASATVGSTHNG